MEDTSYYGAPSAQADSKLLGDRLRELYGPDEFVVVKNIDVNPIKYQFVKPSSIETFSSYPGHKDTVMHEPPKVVILQPGEQKLCPAYEADLMISNLIKQITSTKTAKAISEGSLAPNQSTNWNESNTRESLIDQIYLGKQNIEGMYDPTPKASQAANDLDSEVSNVGRPRKTA